MSAGEVRLCNSELKSKTDVLTDIIKQKNRLSELRDQANEESKLKDSELTKLRAIVHQKDREISELERQLIVPPTEHHRSLIREVHLQSSKIQSLSQDKDRLESEARELMEKLERYEGMMREKPESKERSPTEPAIVESREEDQMTLPEERKSL